MISIQEFKNVEITVGKVLAVEDHPNADKLMILRVDVGEAAPRTLVAGLKEHYRNEELAGRTVIVVTNLQPAKLRGVESNGMLLAAQEGNKVAVLSPDKELAPGSRVL